MVKDENYKYLDQALTTDVLSTAVIRVMETLGSDEDIFKLLYFDTDSLSKKLEDDEVALKIFKNKEHYKHGNDKQTIEPYPFSPNIQTKHEAFIRCYFNQGEVLNNEWSESQMNIDIYCSHGLWLTSDREKKMKLIRPYAIMARVIELLNADKINKLPIPVGYKHFTVTEDFECIRIYANHVHIESQLNNE